MKPETGKRKPERRTAADGISRWSGEEERREVNAALDVNATWRKIAEKAADTGVTDAELLDFYKETQARLPELLGGMDTGALAGVFERALGSAVVTGVRDGLRDERSDRSLL